MALGKVLVATQVTVSVVDITVTSPSNRVFSLGAAAGLAITADAHLAVSQDAAGNGAVAQELSPGIVFQSGQTVCLGGTAGGIVQSTLLGYLTKDK